MDATARRKAVVGVVVIALSAVLPFLIGHGAYRLGELEYIVSIVMVACGLNIVLGFAGQLFIGPSALFASGGYVAAILASRYEEMQSLAMMCLVSVLAAIVVAGLAAIPTLRVSGFYFGMITLFFALAVPIVASHLSIAGGSTGISLISVLTFEQRPAGLRLYELGVAMVALISGYSWLLLNSRFGRQLTAVRASDELAQAVGVPIRRAKLAVFLLAAVPCGLGGAYYVYTQQFISPGSVSPTLSIYMLAAVVIGGGGTILGPVIGAVVVLAANEFLGGFERWQGVVFGVLLIAVAIGLPTGIVGAASSLWSRWEERRSRRTSTGSEVRSLPPARTLSLISALAGAELPDRAARTLTVRGATKSFGGVRAVDDVDLTVEPGTVHALVGTNGSGKTTLLNLICGFYPVDAGEIWLGDRRLDGRGVSAITRLGVARTFQTPKLSIGDSTLHNVLLTADLHSGASLVGSAVRAPRSRRRDAQARQRAVDTLAGLGLGDVAHVPAGGLSHGTQRLVEIARAATLNPMVMLLDEPAAGLSIGEAELLKEAVRTLSAAGLGVLLIEHNLPVVFDVADLVTVMDRGVVIAEGTPAEVGANAEVVRVYLGRTRVDPDAAKIRLAEGVDG